MLTSSDWQTHWYHGTMHVSHQHLELDTHAPDVLQVAGNVLVKGKQLLRGISARGTQIPILHLVVYFPFCVCMCIKEEGIP